MTKRVMTYTCHNGEDISINPDVPETQSIEKIIELIDGLVELGDEFDEIISRPFQTIRTMRDMAVFALRHCAIGDGDRNLGIKIASRDRDGYETDAAYLDIEAVDYAGNPDGKDGSPQYLSLEC